MTELLFGLTVIFIAYVLYEVFKTVSANGADTQTTQTAPTISEPAPAKRAAAEPAPVSAEAAPATAPAAEAEKSPTLRNPADGETAPVPRNYRFAKKWIKEALVTEGLLTKVYKNSELTGEVADKVKDALETFRTLKKYHG